MSTILTIDALHAEVAGALLLHGVGLQIGGGAVHAILGPSGSGTGTVAKGLAGGAGRRVAAGPSTSPGR